MSMTPEQRIMYRQFIRDNPRSVEARITNAIMFMICFVLLFIPAFTICYGANWLDVNVVDLGAQMQPWFYLGVPAAFAAGLAWKAMKDTA